MTFRVIVSVALIVCAAPRGGAGQDDLSLANAVRRGLESHPVLVAASASADAAAARHREAGASRYPSVSLDANAIRFQEPMIVAPLHAFDPARPPTFNATLIQSRLGAAYTVFDGGARSGRREQTAAGFDETRAHVDRTRMETVDRIVRAYLGTLTGREIHAAAGRRLASLRAERARVALVVEAGAAARVELLRIEAALAQGEADSVRADRDLLIATRDLTRQIGSEGAVVDPDRLTPVRRLRPPPAPSPATLLERARATNPDWVAATQRVSAAQAGWRVARAARLPTVRFRAGFLTFGSAGGAFTGEWQAGVAVAYPIFSGGARGHRVARAEADIAAADAGLETLGLRIAGEIDRALGQIAESEARVAALERAVTHLTEVVRIEQLALETGAGVQTDFLRAEADLFATRSSLAVARQAEVAGHVALARILGVLSLDWVATELENVS